MKFLVNISLIIAITSIVQAVVIPKKDYARPREFLSNSNPTKLHNAPLKDKRGVYNTASYGSSQPTKYLSASDSIGHEQYRPLTVAAQAPLQALSFHGGLDSSALQSSHSNLQLLPAYSGLNSAYTTQAHQYAAPVQQLAAQMQQFAAPIQQFAAPAHQYAALAQYTTPTQYAAPAQYAASAHYAIPTQYASAAQFAAPLQYALQPLDLKLLAGNSLQQHTQTQSQSLADQFKVGPIKFEGSHIEPPASLFKPQVQYGFTANSLSLNLPATTYGIPSHSAKVPIVSSNPFHAHVSQLPTDLSSVKLPLSFNSHSLTLPYSSLKSPLSFNPHSLQSAGLTSAALHQSPLSLSSTHSSPYGSLQSYAPQSLGSYIPSSNSHQELHSHPSKLSTSYTSLSTGPNFANLNSHEKPGSSYSPIDPSSYEKHISASLGLEKGFSSSFGPPNFPPNHHSKYPSSQHSRPQSYEPQISFTPPSAGYKSSFSESILSNNHHHSSEGNLVPPPSHSNYDSQDYSSHNDLLSEYNPESSDSSISNKYAVAPAQNFDSNGPTSYNTIAYSDHVEPIKDITTDTNQ